MLQSRRVRLSGFRAPTRSLVWSRRPGTKGQRSSHRGARRPALPTTATENLCESSRPAYTLTFQHKGSRVEGIPPGLCAGPRPRPARGARVHPGGGGVPGSFMKAPLETQSPAYRERVTRLATPALTSHQAPPGPTPGPLPSWYQPSPLRPFAQVLPQLEPLLAPPRGQRVL